ncbi:sphingomyelin phosphodiesterase [Tribolium castaneum]|uniref:sphingomyelin phosphodiesterase n=1 Tax=Tribolium castaneum TaxID=7070 RepID=UPI0030FEFEF0
MAPSTFLSLLFFVTIFTLTTCKKVTIEDLEPLETGLREYFQTGQATDEFLKTLHSYEFPYLFRDGMEKFYDSAAVCYMCSLVVDFVINQRKNAGVSRETILDEATFLCSELKMEAARVCKGQMELNIDIFLYTIDNYPNFTSNRVCGGFLQGHNCDTGDAFEWTINIPSGNSPERPKPSGTDSFTILQLSDIHYDPNYTPNGNAVCGEPVCCQPDQGEPSGPENACGYWTDYRLGDSPWYLIEETIRQTKTQQVDYVYYTGDIIVHRTWETSIESNTEAITKLYSYFKDSYDVPVYPIFGNHESHPLNVWPNDKILDDKLSIKWLFELAAKHWSELIGEDVSETVLKGGYYTVSPRPGFRIIGMNSNVAYTDNWWLMYDDVDPYGQLQWLSDTLKKAEDNNESVHILTHVPTGCSYSLKVWNREYRKILERFANTITGHFNGHTHRDEFLVYYNSSNPTQAIGAAFNGASVTPYDLSNPSFKYYHVDETTFNLLDYEEWAFNLTLANSYGSSKLPEWYKLYSFVEAYGVDNLLPSEVDKVLYKMTDDHSLLDDYFKFKFRNGDPGISPGCDDGCKKDLLCDIATTVFGDDAQCKRFLDLYDQ